MGKTKVDRRVLRSKLALKEALLSLMAAKSFSQVTITEIVETANYNRGTFYAHYENKEALLDEVLGELIEELIAAFRAPYDQVELFKVEEMPATAVKRISSEDLEHASKSPINQELMQAYSMNALMGLLFHWIEGGFQYEPAYMQEQLVLILNYRPGSTKTHVRK